jgi:hypothetical protein
MPMARPYRLVRFRDAPDHPTDVAETRTAHVALGLVEHWEAAYPDDTIIIYNPTAKPLRDGYQSAGHGSSTGRPESTHRRRV